MKPRRVWLKGANSTNHAVPRRACGGALTVHALHSVAKSTACVTDLRVLLLRLCAHFPWCAFVHVHARSNCRFLELAGKKKQKQLFAVNKQLHVPPFKANELPRRSDRSLLGVQTMDRQCGWEAGWLIGQDDLSHSSHIYGNHTGTCFCPSQNKTPVYANKPEQTNLPSERQLWVSTQHTTGEGHGLGSCGREVLTCGWLKVPKLNKYVVNELIKCVID